MQSFSSVLKDRLFENDFCMLLEIRLMNYCLHKIIKHIKIAITHIINQKMKDLTYFILILFLM